MCIRDRRVGTLEDLCRGCDYLTLHVPSKADTIGMISTEQLALLAPGAVPVSYTHLETRRGDLGDGHAPPCKREHTGNDERSRRRLPRGKAKRHERDDQPDDGQKGQYEGDGKVGN